MSTPRDIAAADQRMAEIERQVNDWIRQLDPHEIQPLVEQINDLAAKSRTTEYRMIYFLAKIALFRLLNEYSASLDTDGH